MAASCMRNEKYAIQPLEQFGYCGLAMGRIPRYTERISSF